MKNIATAYMARRYAKGGSAAKMGPVKLAEGGEMMCAHGGPTMCAHGCYDEGGMVDDVDGFADHDDNLFDESHEQENFDDDIRSEGTNEDEPQKLAKGGAVLKKILGKISKHHTGR